MPPAPGSLSAQAHPCAAPPRPAVVPRLALVPRRVVLRLLAAWRLLRTLGHALLGVVAAWLVFPRLGGAARAACVGNWSRALFGALGVRFVASGGRVPTGPRLLVANHVSWLDAMALHALCPHARFVAMAELRDWGGAARLAAAAGTIYLQRRRLRDLWRVKQEVTAALRAGDTVVVFPEGVVSDRVLPRRFHANLLQAAIDAGVPVQPVALRYVEAGRTAQRAAMAGAAARAVAGLQPDADADAVGPAVDFTGGVTLAQSLWRLAAARRLELHAQVLAPMAAASGEHRRALAARVHAAVVCSLRTSLSRHQPVATAAAGRAAGPREDAAVVAPARAGFTHAPR